MRPPFSARSSGARSTLSHRRPSSTRSCAASTRTGGFRTRSRHSCPTWTCVTPTCGRSPSARARQCTSTTPRSIAWTSSMPSGWVTSATSRCIRSSGTATCSCVSCETGAGSNLSSNGSCAKRPYPVSGVFDLLSDKLQAVLSDVRSRGKLNEDDVNKAMREIRLALLEADVNFRVVKQFTNAVKERALGHEVLESLNPGQQVVKVVNEELTALMGESSRQVTISPNPPTVILMAGLQGSGKTTACGKLARLLKEEGRDVALAACDVYRPAAVDQLVKVGGQAEATVYEQGTDRDPRDIAAWAVDQATR